MVTSPLGFKAIVGSFICAWWRRTCYTYPDINLDWKGRRHTHGKFGLVNGFLFFCKCLSVCIVWSHFDIATFSVIQNVLFSEKVSWIIKKMKHKCHNFIIPVHTFYFKENKRNCKTKHKKHISVVTDNAESSQWAFSIVLTTAAELSCLWKKERKSRESRLS